MIKTVRGLYQYKVTGSLAAIHRPGHWVNNRKMAYHGVCSMWQTTGRQSIVFTNKLNWTKWCLFLTYQIEPNKLLLCGPKPSKTWNKEAEVLLCSASFCTCFVSYLFFQPPSQTLVWFVTQSFIPNKRLCDEQKEHKSAMEATFLWEDFSLINFLSHYVTLIWKCMLCHANVTATHDTHLLAALHLLLQNASVRFHDEGLQSRNLPDFAWPIAMWVGKILSVYCGDCILEDVASSASKSV